MSANAEKEKVLENMPDDSKVKEASITADDKTSSDDVKNDKKIENDQKLSENNVENEEQTMENEEKSEVVTTEDELDRKSQKDNDKDDGKKDSKINKDVKNSTSSTTISDKNKKNAISLGQIPKIDANITNSKADTLQTLHTIIYDTPGKVNMIKKNLRKFNGFDFDTISQEYKKRVEAAQKIDIKHLRFVCDILELNKKGSKEELSDKICSFLVDPDIEDDQLGDDVEGENDEEEEVDDEEEEEEEVVVKKKPETNNKRRRDEKSGGRGSSGRPKRSTAGRGYNREIVSSIPDYSSSDESDERFVRTKNKRKRDQSDSGSDYNPSGGGSDSDVGRRKSTRAQRGRPPGRRAAAKRNDSSEEEESASSEEETYAPKKKISPRGGRRPGRPQVNKKKKNESDESEESDNASVESEEQKTKRARMSPKTKVKSPNVTPIKGGRGRPKRSVTANTKITKDETTSEEEPEQEKDDGSEDEPLAKKTKTQPPTDDEIKLYVKEILDDANLEEITMKTVCKQVYAKYPQFDLSHKKDFIKATVKSLIAT